MSQAFWCDYGEHAAKKDDSVVTMSRPVKQMVITDQFGQHIGQAPVQQIDICGECAVQLGLSNDYEAVDAETRQKAIASTVLPKKGGGK